MKFQFKKELGICETFDIIRDISGSLDFYRYIISA